ncbi:DMT family transporter [Thermococcus sp. MAR1]|uniref:DMT family transporter n=1 Tax=Thermococcus sp. MAR1 TaxID=1638263 RepID=UPI00143AA325|nr:DMT family transporter [Thermococcus sp. MAR1]NJE09415.1 DMT family transporter [Thermococcus sp. MAR1]
MNVTLGVILAISAAFVWALASVLSKVSMRDIDPISLNVLRLILSALFYVPLVIYIGFPHLSPLQWAILIVSGIVGFTLADWFFLEGMNLLGVSRAAILVTFHPILTMFVAHYTLDRPLTFGLLAGAFFIVLAVVVIASEGGSDGETSWRGLAYVFSAQLLWTFAVIVTDWLVKGESAFAVIGLRIGFGALASLVFLPRIQGDVEKLGARGWGLVFVITLLGTILGQYFFALALKLAGSSIATPVTESSPIMASVIAVLFLKERFTEKLGVALVLTSLGILMIALFS